MERSVPMANTIEEASSNNDVVMVEPTKKKPQMQINPIFTNIVTDGSTQSNVEAKLRRMP